MSFLRSKFGKKEVKEERKEVKCNFRGQVVPVTKELHKFVQKVLSERKQYGLQLKIDSFVTTYGELLNRNSHMFSISPSKGPCSVICAQCEVEFSEQTIATLGTKSVMAAFGMPPITRCPECGSNSIIVLSVV